MCLEGPGELSNGGSQLRENVKWLADTTDVLQALLEAAPAELLQQTNEAGSPPVHWAVMNNHVACVQALVDVPEERGGGLPLLKVSAAGPAGVALLQLSSAVLEGASGVWRLQLPKLNERS